MPRRGRGRYPLATIKVGSGETVLLDEVLKKAGLADHYSYAVEVIRKRGYTTSEEVLAHLRASRGWHAKRMVTFNGKEMPISEAAKLAGISRQGFAKRLSRDATA